MFLKFPEIEFGVNGFDEHDFLNRRGAAHQLTELVDRIDDPLVIVLDGEWGTGKTHFLKLWPSEHKEKGGKAKLVYFDAFAHDFLEDPLTSLVIRLDKARSSMEGNSEGVLENMKNAAKRLAVPLTRIVAAFAIPGVSANAMAELEHVLNQAWDNEESRITAIENFREALSNLARENKIVFIVDELDRCRPDHALNLLEIVKHFFEIENVHFVLGVNMDVLKKSGSRGTARELMRECTFKNSSI